jgi:hypothetical protein
VHIPLLVTCACLLGPPARAQEPVSFVGRLVNAQGDGVQGRGVKLGWGGGAARAISDAQGRYALSVPIDRIRSLELEVLGEDSPPLLRVSAALTDLGEPFRIPPILIGGTGVLVVRLIEQSTGDLETRTTVMANRTVPVQMGGNPVQVFWSVSTAADPESGEYRLRLPAGTYNLACRTSSGRQQDAGIVTVDPGFEQVLEVSRSFIFLEFDWDTSGAGRNMRPPGSVVLIGADGVRHSSQDSWGGASLFEGLERGQYRLILGPRFEPIARTFVGDQGVVYLSLRPSSGLKLRVLTPSPDQVGRGFELRGWARRPGGNWSLPVDLGAGRDLRIGERVGLGLADGEWLLGVRADGGPERVEWVLIGDGPRRDFDLLLHPPAATLLRLGPGPAGMRPWGLALQLRRAGLVLRKVKTDSRGRARFELPRERFTAHVEYSPWLRVERELDLTGGVPAEVTLPAPPAGFIRGQVELAGLPAGLRPVLRLGPAGRLVSVVPGVSGRFEAGPLPVAVPVLVQVEFRGVPGTVELTRITLTPGETRELALDPLSHLPGTLQLTLTRDGAVLGGGEVSAVSATGLRSSAISDGAGRVRLTGVLPGEYHIEVRPKGVTWRARLSRTLRVTPLGELRALLDLPTVQATLELHGRDGRPLVDFGFCFALGEGSGNPSLARTNHAGRWSARLPPGPLTLWPQGSRPDFGARFDWPGALDEPGASQEQVRPVELPVGRR